MVPVRQEVEDVLPDRVLDAGRRRVDLGVRQPELVVVFDGLEGALAVELAASQKP